MPVGDHDREQARHILATEGQVQIDQTIVRLHRTGPPEAVVWEDLARQLGPALVHLLDEKSEYVVRKISRSERIDSPPSLVEADELTLALQIVDLSHPQRREALIRRLLLP